MLGGDAGVVTGAGEAITLSAVGYILVLICAPVAAVGSLVFLHERRLIHAVDYATIVLPPVVFAVIGHFRPALHVG